MDRSGSMGPEKGTVLEKTVRRMLQDMPSRPSSQMRIVITDGDPEGNQEPLPPMAEIHMPGTLVRLDHSGSTLDGRPLQEGFWRSEQEPDLPMPVPDDTWPEADRLKFVSRLSTLERQAGRTAYRGSSTCRICRCRNGNATLKLGAWEWPSGYMHYVSDHGVRPSAGFRSFVDSAFIETI